MRPDPTTPSQPESLLESLRDELDADAFGAACQEHGVDLFMVLHVLLYDMRKGELGPVDVSHPAYCAAWREVARVRCVAAKRAVAS